jgi:hypothetical protein
MEKLSRCLLIYYYLYVVLLYNTMLFTIIKLNYLLGCSDPVRGFDFRKFRKRIVSF